MMEPKKEMCNELNKLVLEVLYRLERENPKLLKSLLLSPEEQVPKIGKAVVGMMIVKGNQKRPLRE